MGNLALKALGGAANAAGNFLDLTRKGVITRPRRGPMESEFFNRILKGDNNPAVWGVVGLVGAASMLPGDMVRSRGAAKVGRVKYADGMSKMTMSFTTGAPEAMHRASKGDYGTFAEMAKDVVGSGFSFDSGIDDLGANPAFISALYGMGR